MAPIAEKLIFSSNFQQFEFEPIDRIPFQVPIPVSFPLTLLNTHFSDRDGVWTWTQMYYNVQVCVVAVTIYKNT